MTQKIIIAGVEYEVTESKALSESDKPRLITKETEEAKQLLERLEGEVQQ
jgi:hypothetical protein